MAEESDAMLHPAHHLLPHPLGDVHVPHQDHHRTRDEPQREETEEGIVESSLKYELCTMQF